MTESKCLGDWLYRNPEGEVSKNHKAVPLPSKLSEETLVLLLQIIDPP